MPAAPLASAGPSRISPVPARDALCSFTIDVEDWYQSSVDFDAPISPRVVHNVEIVCALLEEHGVKATFFVQGRVAETFPRLLQDLVARGHEIQSHGYSHRSLLGMDRRALREELDLARRSVEDACGVRVTAFRAPDFSILRENLWALEVLADAGFLVDSSIFPLRTKRYGIAGWDPGPRRIPLPGGAEILEVPVAVLARGPLRLPVAGGGYFRVLPVPLLESALRTIMGAGRPAIVYCHPYEFNPSELREYRGRAPRSFLFTQGLGRGAFTGRVRRLLQRLPFRRFDEVVAGWRSRCA
jgi:polysaccharide deacetylase family protein (PEP-CTERM system associated)